MNFTEYHSKALLEVRARLLKEHGVHLDDITRRKTFSSWQMDDLCAINWKNENPLAICVNVLLDYLKTC